MIEYADVIVDLQAGDTGKGKVCNTLSEKHNEYTHVVRYNGGGNAGHTIYKNGKKIVTHFIPSGIVNGVKSIIGPGCVVNPIKLLQEIKQLEHSGIEVVGNLFIDKRVQIITAEHIDRDSTDTKIGTTKTGNGPCYSDKYTRSGNRAENAEVLESFVIDIYDELHNGKDTKILFEGAQGFELDVDWGDYPYVTSSHCTVGSAVLNGVPPDEVLNTSPIFTISNSVCATFPSIYLSLLKTISLFSNTFSFSTKVQMLLYFSWSNALPELIPSL